MNVVMYRLTVIYMSLQKQVGCFNHRLVTLVADKLERVVLWEVCNCVGIRD